MNGAPVCIGFLRGTDGHEIISFCQQSRGFFGNPCYTSSFPDDSIRIYFLNHPITFIISRAHNRPVP